MNIVGLKQGKVLWYHYGLLLYGSVTITNEACVVQLLGTIMEIMH